jgi:hypothetical protein
VPNAVIDSSLAFRRAPPSASGENFAHQGGLLPTGPKAQSSVSRSIVGSESSAHRAGGGREGARRRLRSKEGVSAHAPLS